MTWDELIIDCRQLLIKSNLKSVQRFTELRELDDLMRKYFPNIVNNPDLLLERNKEQFKQSLKRVLHKNLNGAESSIVDNFYRLLKNK